MPRFDSVYVIGCHSHSLFGETFIDTRRPHWLVLVETGGGLLEHVNCNPFLFDYSPIVLESGRNTRFHRAVGVTMGCFCFLCDFLTLRVEGGVVFAVPDHTVVFKDEFEVLLQALQEIKASIKSEIFVVFGFQRGTQFANMSVDPYDASCQWSAVRARRSDW